MKTINYSDYICGYKFINISHHNYSLDNKIPQRNAIIYCNSDDIENCLSTIRKNANNNYVLISHNGDRNVEQPIVDSRPDNLYWWFAQNANAAARNFEGLPIGISNPEWGELGSIQQIEDNVSLDIKPSRLVYMGCKLETNYAERWLWSEHLVENFTKEQQYHHFSRINRKAFIQECLRSWFIISPPGNGIDCHRTWESLYMGRVPIVKESVAMQYFTDLPIITYKKIEDITEKVLFDLIEWWYPKGINHPKMWMQYWIKRINDKFKEING